jgi:thiol-disulfide isomerase/thioredoxin
MRRLVPVVVLCVLGMAPSPTPAPPAPVPSPTPSAAAPPTMLDLRMLRLKVSAGDLYSAESILEEHRAEKGEDDEYVLGLAWLARGAALLGDWDAASRHARAARAIAVTRLGTPPVYEGRSEATYALGTAIEVEAQALLAAGKKDEAIRLLEESAKAQEKAPYNLRARIWKRRNQIEFVGRKAPDFRPEDRVGADFPGLAALAGKPIVLFLWWESCGDCRAQASALRRTVERFAPRGVVFVAPTRFYTEDRSAEKARIETAWRETYALPPEVSVPISGDAMLRYGVSATPTFVFIDRSGAVRGYLPYRMTDERLAQAIESLLR